VTGDVTDLAQIDTMRQRVEDGCGPVDILVANAGGSSSPAAPLEQISEDQWRAAIDGNLLATFLTLKAFLPGMKQRGYGSVVTVASSAGRRADARAPLPYAVAKAAIVHLTQHTALQAGAHGVRVNCVAPETILTERVRSRIPMELQATMSQAHPLRRLGTPEDVADAVAFLASDQAAWITGTVLDITGGAVLV
jgi:3-oxoacyl-[acyl-carrier protein] reductase